MMITIIMKDTQRKLEASDFFAAANFLYNKLNFYFLSDFLSIVELHMHNLLMSLLLIYLSVKWWYRKISKINTGVWGSIKGNCIFTYSNWGFATYFLPNNRYQNHNDTKKNVLPPALLHTRPSFFFQQQEQQPPFFPAGFYVWCSWKKTKILVQLQMSKFNL